MELILTWRELLIAVVLATVVYLLESVVFAKRRRQQAPPGDPAAEQQLRQLRAEVSTLRNRLDALEAKLGMVEPAEVDNAHAAYDYAIQYARQGMIAPEIAARCGISRDEAALIVAMLQKGQVPGTGRPA